MGINETWLCIKDDTLKGKDVFIVTGDETDPSITLFNRMKVLFDQKRIIEFDTREKVFVCVVVVSIIANFKIQHRTSLIRQLTYK